MKTISSNLIRAALLAVLSAAGVAAFAAAYSSMYNEELMPGRPGERNVENRNALRAGMRERPDNTGEAEREHDGGELRQQRPAQEESGSGGISEGDDGTEGAGELRLYIARHQHYASVGWSPSSWSATCGCADMARDEKRASAQDLDSGVGGKHGDSRRLLAQHR